MVWQVIAQWSLIFQYLKPQNYAFIHQWIYRAKLPEILNWSIKLIYLQVKSPGIKNHQSFCSFLVHYSVPTFSASDWISCFYFIFCMTFSTNVNHWLLLGRLNILLWIHVLNENNKQNTCFSLLAYTNITISPSTVDRSWKTYFKINTKIFKLCLIYATQDDSRWKRLQKFI